MGPTLPKLKTGEMIQTIPFLVCSKYIFWVLPCQVFFWWIGNGTLWTQGGDKYIATLASHCYLRSLPSSSHSGKLESGPVLFVWVGVAQTTTPAAALTPRTAPVPQLSAGWWHSVPPSSCPAWRCSPRSHLTALLWIFLLFPWTWSAVAGSDV